MLIAHTNAQLHLWDVAARLDLGQPGSSFNANQVLAVSPDGELVVMRPQTNQLELRDLRTGGLVRSLKMPGCKFQNPKFAPKAPGRRMAFATVESSAVKYWLWDVDSGQQPFHVDVGTNPGLNFAFSSDGNLLAFADADGIILLYNVASHQARRLSASVEGVNHLAISWDGALLAACANQSIVRLWEIHSGRELQPLVVPEFSADVADFRLDGQTLITCNFGGDVRFWNIALRKELVLVNHNMGFFLLLSPDGSALAMPAPKAFAKRGNVSVWWAPTLAESDGIESAKMASSSKFSSKDSE